MSDVFFCECDKPIVQMSADILVCTRMFNYHQDEDGLDR